MRKSLIEKRSMPVSLQREKENPFIPLQNELNKAMKEFYNVFDFPNVWARDFENLAISPSIDIVEDDSNFKIEAEMPGVGEDDVHISLAEGQLTIKAEKTTSKEDKEKNYIAREIGYGSYERIISLPDTVDLDKAKASFKKGMLWVTIPKKEGSGRKVRQLKVEKIADNKREGKKP